MSLNIIRMIVAISLSLLSLYAIAADGEAKSWWDGNIWEDPDRGFNWYPPDAPKKPQIKPKKEDTLKKLKEAKTMDELRAQVQKIKDVAIMNPTEANVKRYLEAQTFMMDKSALFADQARRVVWQTPSVDYNNRSSIASIATLDKRSQRAKDTRNNMFALSQDYGLMFFFREDCRYCHIQAPILKIVEKDYGMNIIAVAMDGGKMPQFPDAVPDNGISTIVSRGEGVTVTPAIYLVNRKGNDAILLGTGVLAAADITERIRVLTTTKPGQEF